MSHDEEYQRNFIPSASVIITPYLTLKSPYGALLSKDSYTNPGDAFLKITSNNNEDVVFNGIVIVKKGVTEHGRITCRHIIFMHNTKCVISKLEVDSVDAMYSVDVELSFNKHIMSFTGNSVGDIKDFFPNLIIKSEYVMSDGSELICLIFNNVDEPQAMFNTAHEYYPALTNAGIYKKRYGNIGNIEFCYTTNNNSDICVLSNYVLKIIDCVKEAAAALIKNANK
jgi:hypothetical protein